MTRLRILENVATDTSRLYGTLDDAISYLEELKEEYGSNCHGLEENWIGYEDMTMSVVIEREESDWEYERRIANEERKREEVNRLTRFEAETRADRAEFERLRIKLGIR